MKKIITVIIFITLPITILAQGFNSIHSPDGINVFAVGDSGKIYRSSNSGLNWYIYSNNSVNLKSVYSLGNNVWFVGEFSRIYKTNLNLNPISLIGISQNFTINSIFFVNPNLGFLCGEGGNIYKSINGGLNWNLINSGIANLKFHSVSFKDSLNGVVVGENGKIYITTNSGSSWISQTIPTTKTLFDVKYFNDGIVVAGEYGTLLLKPSGLSWTQVNTRTNSDIKGLTGSSISDVHICGGGGFIRNNKNGSNKFLNFEINPMMANLIDIFYYNSNTGFAISSLNKAVIKTTNGGQSWELPAGATVFYQWIPKTPSGSGIGNNLCMHPKNRNSAFVVYGNKVYVSRDRSETWTQIATISIGSRAHSFYVSPVDTNIWLAAMESSPDCVVRTTNYGATWTAVIAGDFSTYGQPLEMDQNNPSTFYFAPSSGSGIGVYKSTDNGATFNLTAPYTISAINQPCDLIVMWDSSNVLYMGDDGADIFKSTNNAMSWFLVKPSSSNEVPSMCNTVFDKSICYATTWGSSQVYKTVNHGDNWNVISNNSGSGWASDICHEDPTVVLTGNYGSQSYLSTNGGANFFNVNNGLSGGGAGIMVPERGWFLNMQTSTLYKLNIIYSVIDSQVYIPPSSLIKINSILLIEGMYFPISNQMTRKDSVKVYLNQSTPPYNRVDSAKTAIDSISFTGQLNFSNAPTGTYYISVNHLNSIETWSKSGGEYLIDDGIAYNYDFTISASQAYGNNLKLKGGKYCFYSGDVNQDGVIESQDFAIIDNDTYRFLTGSFLPSDLNGDNQTDSQDMTIADNNRSFISVIRP